MPLLTRLRTGPAQSRIAGMTDAADGNEPALTRWTRATVYPDMWLDPADFEIEFAVLGAPLPDRVVILQTKANRIHAVVARAAIRVRAMALQLLP